MLYNCKCTFINTFYKSPFFLLKAKVNASKSLQNLPGEKMQSAATVLCVFLDMSFSGPLPQLMCAKQDTIFQKLQSGNQDYFSVLLLVF